MSDTLFEDGMKNGEQRGKNDARAGFPERPEPGLEAQLLPPEYRIGFVSGYLHGFKSTELAIEERRNNLLENRDTHETPTQDIERQ